MKEVTKNIFGKNLESLTIEDIKRLIKNEKEENQYIEYKSPEILRSPEKLSKTISGFLNADGGILIIGIEEKPRGKDSSTINQKIYPTDLMPIKNYSLERVEQLILDNIFCSTRPMIKIHNIKFNKGSVFVIEIPQGDNPPYQAKDGRYYRRINVINWPMLHYEIRDLFGKRKKPLLRLLISIEKVEKENSNTIFTLRLYIVNKGNSIAKYTRLSASFHNVEILSTEGHFQRLDNLRKLPSIQFDELHGVFYPTFSREANIGAIKTNIGAIKLKIIDNEKPVIIDYDIICEDMDLYKGKIVLSAEDIEGLGLISMKSGSPRLISDTEDAF